MNLRCKPCKYQPQPGLVAPYVRSMRADFGYPLGVSPSCSLSPPPPPVLARELLCVGRQKSSTADRHPLRRHPRPARCSRRPVRRLPAPARTARPTATRRWPRARWRSSPIPDCRYRAALTGGPVFVGFQPPLAPLGARVLLIYGDPSHRMTIIGVPAPAARPRPSNFSRCLAARRRAPTGLGRRG